jgi:hypothetical protein
VAYLNAKKAPTIKPGTEMINIEAPIERATSTPRTPEAREAIMSIKTVDLVAGNSSDLAWNSISGFLS